MCWRNRFATLKNVRRLLGYVSKYEKTSLRPKQYAIAEGTIKNVELLYKSLKQ